MTAAPLTTVGKFKVLGVNALDHGAEYDRTTYLVRVDDKTFLSDVLKPGFWAHHANKLKPLDMIEVVSEDMELDCVLRVIATDTGLVNVRPLTVGHTRSMDNAALMPDEEEEDLPEMPGGYEAKSIASGWVVRWKGVRPPIVIAEELLTEREAIEAAIDHAEKAKAAA